MLYPEVWDFEPVRHYISTEVRNSEKTSPSELKTSYFNHSVCIVLPDTANVPDSVLAELTEDVNYYRVDSVPVAQLLNKEFIEAFVKQGELTALSIGKKIDLDNCIAICPTGKLLLSLVAEDYHKLGLEGRPSFFSRGLPNRYVITIDLKADDFSPGRKNYDHAVNALENRLDETFDIILAWDPPEMRICPSSVAAWFHDRGYKVSLCREKYTGRAEYSMLVPTLVDGYDIQKVFEWIGVFSVGGDLTAKEENGEYVNSYKCPEPNTNVGQIQFLQWTGLFTRKQITKMYNTIKKYSQSKEPTLWNCFHVQGFADAIISFTSKEHNYYLDGDNSFTILLQPNEQYIIQKSCSSNNKPRGGL